MNTKDLCLLDGRLSAPADIIPRCHKFIGTFRYPAPDQHGFGPFDYCPRCRRAMHTSGASEIRSHWMDGHFDIPQYVTIEEST